MRIIRAVRFAAKLGFEIEAKTRAPIKEMAALLDNVPQSRTFDEMIKLLQTGHALASIVELKKLGLHRGVFPMLDVALDEAQRHDGREKFVRAALADTDARVAAGKPVAPSFMLAAMLWHDVLRRLAPAPGSRRVAVSGAAGRRSTPPSTRASATSPGAASSPPTCARSGCCSRASSGAAASSAPALLEQPRFRAGLDFLRLRAEVGEADPALAAWWEALFDASDDERREMLEAVREQRGPRRVKRAAPPRVDAADVDGGHAGARTNEAADAVVAGVSNEEAAEGAAPRKRRRRRRRPAADPAGTPS